jgi:hypothetical protein
MTMFEMGVIVLLLIIVMELSSIKYRLGTRR